ncbi:MAG: helix-turn-helix transcriptional regulator [Humidesulfovibrio sp.]|nr:helix-turn-helix transcriptional regulator [Humidesulfovibrio sp.]
MQNLGARLRRLRHQAKLTQAELAESASISCVYVNKLERGLATPSIPVLQRLAQSLGTDAASLLTPEEQGPSLSINGARPSPYLALYLAGVASKTRRLVFETMDTPLHPNLHAPKIK